jgi:hypothetical protein
MTKAWKIWVRQFDLYEAASRFTLKVADVQVGQLENQKFFELEDSLVKDIVLGTRNNSVRERLFTEKDLELRGSGHNLQIGFTGTRTGARDECGIER